MRGSAQQVLDKYLQLGRDAHSAGDRVAAEAYFQFAEHYYRILNANAASDDRSSRPERAQQNVPGNGGDGGTFDGDDEDGGVSSGRDSRSATTSDGDAANGGATSAPIEEEGDRTPAAKPRGRPRTREKSPRPPAVQKGAQDQQDAASGAADAVQVKEIPIKPTRRGRRKKVSEQDAEVPAGDAKEQISA
ncbi:uncharacterized protein DUF4167 [Varunaivibrio sulfuroxidans]|uniref:Uncharacterized protein DUF4167 n=1 Tax=Varunaivibrio sulfuroxidans TaxID=1773489 RepID=A0A4R3JGN2_9PROT|nr:uncharacterized protein DUF4167 [Varunaivibrio sulfuroxidans]